MMKVILKNEYYFKLCTELNFVHRSYLAPVARFCSVRNAEKVKCFSN